jgi:hypothetical protein
LFFFVIYNFLPPNLTMSSYGNGEGVERTRSRSPVRDDAKAKDWELKYEETRQTGSRLDRHEGARRNTKPAWMTKGLGVGQDMFGAPQGIIKPGDTPEKQPRSAKDLAYDPMGDVFRSVVTDIKTDGKPAQSDAAAASTSTETRAAADTASSVSASPVAAEVMTGSL